MLRRGTYRIVIALVLAAALLAPAASLAAGPSRPAPPWRLGLDALWAWAHVWLGLPGAGNAPAPNFPIRKTACDGGGSIDPNGRTVCQPAAGTNNDAGLHIDPDG